MGDFSCGAFLFHFIDDCLSKCPNSKKFPYSKKFLVTRLMPTHLFQNIQNAQLHKQEDENNSGGSSSSQNINNKKVIYNGAFLRKQLTAKTH